MSRLNNSSRVPLVCYVTDRRSLGARESAEAHQNLLHKIEAAAAAGVDWIQIREKGLSGKECTSLAHDTLRRIAGSPPTKTPSGVSSPASEVGSTRILINDRLDVALAVQAHGVHLGEKNLPPHEARRLVNSLHREKDFLIGVSCHSREAAQTAERGDANYLFFGPIFATPSKAAYGEPQGLERLREVCRSVRLPVLAIGGITLENASACLSAGASGIAAIRLFQDARDIAAVVLALRSF